jgi:hypothetical protein
MACSVPSNKKHHPLRPLKVTLSKQQKKASLVCTMRRVKLLLLMVVIVVTYWTWRFVQLAHGTLPEKEVGMSANSRDNVATIPHNIVNGIQGQLSNNIHNTNEVPFLPPLCKVNPIPDIATIQSSMKTPGNETAGQCLLDFAIIGNAKCGTSTMMNWLHSQYPHIQIPRDELYHLKSREAWDLLGVFYHYFGGPDKLLPNSIKGYKSPSDITNERPIRLLRTYFPQTKLIVGLRHPIYMMESFYNFRIQNGYDMPPLETLHYRNLANQYGVSWSRAEYHTTLMNLGKTNLTSKEELDLFPPTAKKQIQKRMEERKLAAQGNSVPNQDQVAPYVRVPNPLFLYDTTQLESNVTDDSGGDSPPRLLAQFGRDMSNFLGLSSPLPPPPRHSPGKLLRNATLQAQRNAKKIRICDDKYREQRLQLLEIGSRVAKWILDYLLPSEDVFASNPHYFRELLEGYSQDPCRARSE